MAKLWWCLPEFLIRKLNPAKVLCLTIGLLCWHEMDLGTGFSPLLTEVSLAVKFFMGKEINHILILREAKFKLFVWVRGWKTAVRTGYLKLPSFNCVSLRCNYPCSSFLLNFVIRPCPKNDLGFFSRHEDICKRVFVRWEFVRLWKPAFLLGRNGSVWKEDGQESCVPNYTNRETRTKKEMRLK